MTPADHRTRGLVAPAVTVVDEAARSALKGRLVARLAPVVAPLPAADPVVVSLPLLRQAQGRPGSVGDHDGPFVWRPAFVRRSLGLAVVEACAAGRFRNPLDAAGPVASEALVRWKETGWRTYHWEPWMAGLGTGARAAVLAESVAWASSLWTSLDWSMIEPMPQFGGPDDQWACPSTPTVRLKGRSELRVALQGHVGQAGGVGRVTGPVALVSVSGGSPSVAWREELAYLALTAALRSPSRPVPARVTGLWPDAGADRCVEIDEGVLDRAVDRVVDTVATVVTSRQSVVT